MLSIFDSLRDVTLLSVFVRLILAMFCGGIIGAERETKRRPAGFRTHILICLGATMTTLTSQYLAINLGYYTDIGRLGAQVVAGVGFIGAGSIIVTHRQHVKGLTTAAGLWTVAIVGLAIGSGFFEVSIAATILVLIVETLFIHLAQKNYQKSPEINVYLEYSEKIALDSVLHLCKENGLRVENMEFTRQIGGGHSACLILLLRPTREIETTAFFKELKRVTGIQLVTEF